MSHSKIKTRIYEYLPFSLVHFMSFRGQGVPYYSFNWVKSLANFEKYINPPKENYVMHYFDKYRMVFKERDKNYIHTQSRIIRGALDAPSVSYCTYSNVTPLVHINPRFIIPALLYLGVN